MLCCHHLILTTFLFAQVTITRFMYFAAATIHERTWNGRGARLRWIRVLLRSIRVLLLILLLLL